MSHVLPRLTPAACKRRRCSIRKNLSRLPKADLVRTLRDAPNLNGSNLSNVDLSGVNLASANLSGGRFQGADFSGSYLQGVIARHASFIGAKMRGATLPAAMLEGAGFRSADLRMANLRWVDLQGSDMASADLSGAQLFEAKMTNVVLTDANMEKARLESVDLDGAVLRDTRLADAVLHSATLRKADMYGADLRRCDLRGADMDNANLLSARLDGAVYDDTTVFPTGLDPVDRGMCFLGPEAELPRADLTGFEFRGEDLSGADLTRAKLMGADLRGANLVDADLTGARLRGALYDGDTVFPESFDPKSKGAYAVVPRTVIRAAKMQWKRLKGAALSGAQLEDADMTGADLSGAQLNSANLTGAVLYCANMSGSGLHGAVLRRANARGSILQDADLRRADLRGADFSWADFAQADLRGAELAGASLTDARLRGARYDERTTFPAGFDPVIARMMDGEGEAAAHGADASHAATISRLGLRYLSIGDIGRYVQTTCASWIQRSGREMLGQVALCCASVGAFALVGWQAMGIHETPTRVVRASVDVVQAPEAPVSGPRDLELTTIAGAGPISVDLDRFTAPAAPRVDTVVVVVPASSPASVVVAPPTAPRVADDTTSLAEAPVAASVTSPVLLSGPPDVTPTAVAVAPEPSVVDLAPVDAVAGPLAEEQELVVASASADILDAVDQWRSVWEGRDTEAYVDLFHPDHSVARTNTVGRSRQFTKERLSARAQNVFDAYHRIQVNIDNLDVSHEGDLVVSTFDEDFVAWRADAGASPDYVDRGRKTLVYARDVDNEWRIVSEQWRSAQN